MNKMMLSIFKGYADTMPVAVSLDEVVRLIRPLLCCGGVFRRGQAKNRH